MKTVFKIETKKRNRVLLTEGNEYFVFGNKLQNAIQKIEEIIDKEFEIVSGIIYCIVDEDKDLEKYKEE
jgi:hypothetical protein